MKLLNYQALYNTMSELHNLMADGKARKIVEALKMFKILLLKGERNGDATEHYVNIIV